MRVCKDTYVRISCRVDYCTVSVCYFLCVIASISCFDRKWKMAEARIQKQGAPVRADAELVGGLKVPGSIWHYLYK